MAGGRWRPSSYAAWTVTALDPTNLPLLDADEKVTGSAPYATDMRVPGMLHAQPVLSPYASARLVGIDTSRAEAIPGVVAVLTTADLPTAGLRATSRSSALLATDRVVFAGQPVALVVATTAAAAFDGAAAVRVEYDPTPPVVDPEEAMRAGTPAVWPDGIPRGEGAWSEAHAGGAAGTEERGAVSPNVVETVG